MGEMMPDMGELMAGLGELGEMDMSNVDFGDIVREMPDEALEGLRKFAPNGDVEALLGEMVGSDG
jgi:hypothetical protein